MFATEIAAIAGSCPEKEDLRADGCAPRARPPDEGASAARPSSASSRAAPAPARRRHDGRSAKFRQNVARFRLYRHRTLQANTRFSAFFKNLPDYLAEIFEIWQFLQILQHLQNFAEYISI